MDDCITTVNVSGRRFEIGRDVLSRFPDSTLGRLTSSTQKEVFFQRPTAVFKCVLGYHQTGRLHLPASMCLGSVEVYFIISCLVIITSTLLIVLGTLPQFKSTLKKEHWREYFGEDFFDQYYDEIRLADEESDDEDVNEITERHNKTTDDILGNFSLPKDVHVKNENFELVGYICTAFFTVELLLRLCCCPSLVRFFRSLLNIIDVLAVIAAIGKILVEQVSVAEKFKHSYLDILEGMLVLRVLRLFHLTKHITGTRVLVYAFKSSFREVGFMALLLLITSIVFGTVVYYVDSDRMKTIPEACWWAVITMTTVGYGDITPSTAVSKGVGVLCACMGILVLAITMPLFVNNFITFYSIANETSEQGHTTNNEHVTFSSVHPLKHGVLHRSEKSEGAPNSS